MRIVGIILLILILLLGGYGYWNYHYVFSKGYREGILNKFSTKGAMFKTNEGEILMQGLSTSAQGNLSANYFYFSVEKPEIVEQLNNATGKKIKVHYLQYNASLPWRGDNYDDRNSEPGQYIVDEVEVKE